MKTFFHILILSSAAFQIASAEVPKKAPLVKYTGLSTNSPFTSKPDVVPIGSGPNPLDDYTLTGIAPVPGGYRITIMNKKKPDEKKEVIEPGKTNKSGFKVVSVNRNPGKTLGTTVMLSSGSNQGTVSFEPELITLKAAPAAATPAQQGNLPPGITPAMAGQQGTTQNPNGNGENARQPRPRIVPPPTAPPGTTPQIPGNPTNTPTPGGRQNNSQPRVQPRR